MQRFSIRKKHSYSFIIRIMAAVIIVVFFYLVIEHTGEDSTYREKQFLAEAIDRDITECYALEGQYPADLDYMKEHYGLTYNSNKFFVDYTFIGGNIRPDVTIIERK